MVARTGPILLTVKDSQLLVVGLLFASPLYAATTPYGPALVGEIGDELGTTPLTTVTLDTSEPVPEHVPLLNCEYVTVPPA